MLKSDLLKCGCSPAGVKWKRIEFSHFPQHGGVDPVWVVCNYSCRVFEAHCGHCVRCDWNVYGMSFYLHFDDMEYSYSFSNRSQLITERKGWVWAAAACGMVTCPSPVWIRKKSKHDFPILSYANWVADIWIANWIFDWMFFNFRLTVGEPFLLWKWFYVCCAFRI